MNGSLKLAIRALRDEGGAGSCTEVARRELRFNASSSPSSSESSSLFAEIWRPRLLSPITCCTFVTRFFHLAVAFCRSSRLARDGARISSAARSLSAGASEENTKPGPEANSQSSQIQITSLGARFAARRCSACAERHWVAWVEDKSPDRTASRKEMQSPNFLALSDNLSDCSNVLSNAAWRSK